MSQAPAGVPAGTRLVHLDAVDSTNAEAMRRVLCLLLPLAYRILRLRSLHRTSPDESASTVFDSTDILLLGKAQPRPAPAPTTMAEAMALLAKMGGHITNNGPPGWMTLGAGLEKLLILKLGFEMGRDFG